MTIEPGGLILINKPRGLSSHAVVNRLRCLSGLKRVGHAGTLDPLASGLLILALGRSYTKKISRYVKLDKEYRAEIYLGATTNTYDREGKAQPTYFGPPLKKHLVKRALGAWVGERQQKPPLFSALKVKGQKLYKLARRGREVELSPRRVTIYKIKILRYHWPLLKIKVACGSGTYIRSLAYDLGNDLACGAYLYNLQRTKIGPYKLRRAINLDRLNPKNLQCHLKADL